MFAPVTAATEYVAEVIEQIEVGPLISPGVGGAIETAKERGVLEVQELFDFTLITPELNVEANITLILVEVVVIGDVPNVDVTPEGNVQI